MESTITAEDLEKEMRLAEIRSENPKAYQKILKIQKESAENIIIPPLEEKLFVKDLNDKQLLYFVYTILNSQTLVNERNLPIPVNENEEFEEPWRADEFGSALSGNLIFEKPLVHRSQYRLVISKTSLDLVDKTYLKGGNFNIKHDDDIQYSASFWWNIDAQGIIWKKGKTLFGGKPKGLNRIHFNEPNLIKKELIQIGYSQVDLNNKYKNHVGYLIGVPREEANEFINGLISTKNSSEPITFDELLNYYSRSNKFREVMSHENPAWHTFD